MMYSRIAKTVYIAAISSLCLCRYKMMLVGRQCCLYNVENSICVLALLLSRNKQSAAATAAICLAGAVG